MRIIISLCLCIWVAQICQAQDLPSINVGKIVSTQNEPIPYANVVFLDSLSKMAAYGASDERGNFAVTGLTPGNYNMVISCVGYEQLSKNISITPKAIDLGTFQLQAGIQLQEAVVKGYPMIQMGVDRL